MLIMLATTGHQLPRGPAAPAKVLEGAASDDLLNPSTARSSTTEATPIVAPRLKLRVLRDEEDRGPVKPIIDPLSGRIAQFDSTIESQGPDWAWADGLMAAVGVACKAVKGVSLDAVECGQTLCRVEVGLSGDHEVRRQAKIALGKVAMQTSEQFFTVTAPPKPSRLVAYMARENTSLPPLENAPRASRAD